MKASHVFWIRMCITAAMLLLGCAGWYLWQAQKELRTGHVVQGHVVSLEIREIRVNKDSVSRRYHPLFTFQPIDGKPMTVVSEKGRAVKHYHERQAVNVWYRDGEENRAKIIDYFSMYLPSYVSVAGALVLLALAFMLKVRV